MIEVDGLLHAGKMVDEALMDEIERVPILQRMSTFIKELVESGQFAHPSRAPSQHVVYSRREQPQPVGEQYEPRPSQPIDGQCT